MAHPRPDLKKVKTERCPLPNLEPTLAKLQASGWEVLSILPSRYEAGGDGSSTLVEVIVVIGQ